MTEHWNTSGIGSWDDVKIIYSALVGSRGYFGDGGTKGSDADVVLIGIPSFHNLIFHGIGTEHSHRIDEVRDTDTLYVPLNRFVLALRKGTPNAYEWLYCIKHAYDKDWKSISDYAHPLSNFEIGALQTLLICGVNINGFVASLKGIELAIDIGLKKVGEGKGSLIELDRCIKTHEKQMRVLDTVLTELGFAHSIKSTNYSIESCDVPEYLCFDWRLADTVVEHLYMQEYGFRDATD